MWDDKVTYSCKGRGSITWITGFLSSECSSTDLARTFVDTRKSFLDSAIVDGLLLVFVIVLVFNCDINFVFDLCLSLCLYLYLYLLKHHSVDFSFCRLRSSDAHVMRI